MYTLCPRQFREFNVQHAPGAQFDNSGSLPGADFKCLQQDEEIQ